MRKQFYLPNEQATLDFGIALAKDGFEKGVIFLIGELGAGKTTLARGFLRGLGYSGVVKSPTYTLVETYQVGQKTIHHFDFYRLVVPEELELMGIRDYFTSSSICLVEWPERVSEILPPADISCYIQQENEGRRVTLQTKTELGISSFL